VLASFRTRRRSSSLRSRGLAKHKAKTTLLHSKRAYVSGVITMSVVFAISYAVMARPAEPYAVGESAT